MANLAQVIVGSESDLEAVNKSGMIQTMEKGGLDCRLAVASAHRNPGELEQLCLGVLDKAPVFICVAGMATALPGAVAAITKQYAPVIAVPLDEHGIDSCLYMPPGVPVALAGVGSSGLKNAALLALQMVMAYDLDCINQGFHGYMDGLRGAKPAKLDLYRSGLGWKLNEGKTKIIWGDPDGTVVTIESKDDITAGDGAKHDELEGKAVLSTTTTVNCFRALEAAGIPTAFVCDHDQRHFKARRVDMIPLELVTRRLATGSYLKRNPDAVEGEVFDPLVFEFFYKDDARHDPIVLPVVTDGGVKLHLHEAGKPVSTETMIDIIPSLWSMEQLAELERITREVFATLEECWSAHDVALVDLKIECGFDAETGEILVADVIDNDSWRIWPGGDKSQMLDKQVYRDLYGEGVASPAAKAKELGAIKRNYARVAELTGNFA